MTVKPWSLWERLAVGARRVRAVMDRRDVVVYAFIALL